MRSGFSDFWAFLVAVFWRWQAWAGGSGVGGAIVVAIAMYQQITGKVVPNRVYIAFTVVGFLFCAFFLAWRDQYHAAKEAKARLETLSAPRLTLEIDGAGISTISASDPNLNGRTAVFLIASVKNEGAPSIVENYRLNIT